MISSFWNLCRACPSMPVEKLHSEYRSTFQWHEYVGSHNDSVTQPPVVRQPSQSHPNQLSTLAGPEEQSIPRRKKHPELANRSSNGWLTKSSTAYEASLCPDSRSTNISGPGGSGIGGGPRKSMSMGTIRSSGNIAPIHSQKLSLMPEYSRSAGVDDTSAGSGMTASAPGVSSHFMESAGGGGGAGGGEQGALRDFVPSHSAAEVKLHISKEKMSTDGAPEQRNFDEFKKKEYKSEYKKRFRPFSQYEYVDGKFFKKKGDQEIGNPWYKEVIELRKKAGEYKFRGWGTELGPQNIAQVYHQHVWDQVSRRTSLAALALITTTPKSISKEEKDKENARKSYPGKPTHARPHTATPKHPISDLEKSKHLKDSADSVQPSKKKLLEENRIQNKSTSRVKEIKTTTPRPPSHKPTSTLLETKTNKLLREARSHSAGPAGRSPRKTIRQQSAASSASEKDSSSSTGGWKIHLDSSQVTTAPKPQQRHPRPTTLATSPRPKASSGKGDRDSNSKLAKQQQFDKNSADPYLGYNEPVIKSPPEPTRVKSPEQVILRSPDPVNWTVPLDTTKSFTVTQNIREAPPSPRFRAGEKLHGDLRNIHHPASTHHSSAGSTMASSPISSFSSRSAPVPLSMPSGQPGAAAAAATTAATAAPLKSGSLASTAASGAAATATKSSGWSGGGGGGGGGGEVMEKGSNVMSSGVEVESLGGGFTTGGGSGGGGGGGGSGVGKPSTAEISGAGPGSGDGISASKPKHSTTKLEPKVLQQTQSTAHHTINGHGLDEKSEKTPSKSLHKDKVLPTSAKSGAHARVSIGAARSKESSKGHSTSMSAASTPPVSSATASSTSAASGTPITKTVASPANTAASKSTGAAAAAATVHSKTPSVAATISSKSAVAPLTKAAAPAATVSLNKTASPVATITSKSTVPTTSKITASPSAAAAAAAAKPTGVTSSAETDSLQSNENKPSLQAASTTPSKTSTPAATTSAMPLKITPSPPSTASHALSSSTSSDKVRPVSAREVKEARDTSASSIPVARTTKQSPSTSLIIGSGLKCLEDPTFMFDPPKPAPTIAPTAVPSAMTSSVMTSLPPGEPMDSNLTKSMIYSGSKKLQEQPTKSVPLIGTGSKLPQPSSKPQPQLQSAISTVSGKISDSSIPTLKSIPSTIVPSKLPGPELTKSISQTTQQQAPTTAASLELGKSIPTITSKLPGPVSADLGKQSTIPSFSSFGSGPIKLSESAIKPIPTFQSKIPEPSKPSALTSSVSTKEEALATLIPGSTSSAVSGIKAPSSYSPQPKSSFRVLEAPLTAATSPSVLSVELGGSSSLKRKELAFTPPAPVSAPKRVIGGVSHVSEMPPSSKVSSGYRVLEAPDDADEPSVSVISPSSGRSRASDVLEKARHRFDKFWGKSKDEEK